MKRSVKDRIHTWLFIGLVILTIPVTLPAALIGAAAYLCFIGGACGWLSADRIAEKLVE